MYQKLESDLNMSLRQISNNIKKEYPLTTIQKLKLEYIINNLKVKINTTENNYINIKLSEFSKNINITDYCLNELIKYIFSMLIESKNYEINKVSSKYNPKLNMTKEYHMKCLFENNIKTCMIEFLTYKYCKENNISYIGNIGYVLYFAELIDGIKDAFQTNKKLNSLIRIPTDEFENLSTKYNRLYKEFKKNKTCKKYIKKEM